MYETDITLGNANAILGMSEPLGTSDNSVIDNRGSQETALTAPDVASLSKAQVAAEIDSSALSIPVPLVFNEESASHTEVAAKNDVLTGLSENDAAVGNFIDSNVPPFQTGVFTVGESGQVSIDFLFDGGKFESELAIFSLSGMSDYEVGSTEFIREATRRALSNSTEGYVAISDRTERARFDGILGNHEGKNWSSGEYVGTKSFMMTPGDQFGFMLAPSRKLEELLDEKGIKETPLFSISEVNPEGVAQLTQLIDIEGSGNSFSFEDIAGKNSDRDYNDFIFQVQGAIGKALTFDDVVNT